MARKVYALLCLAAATFAAEPVNQEAELTLDLLEFLAEFGDHVDAVPLSDDELDSASDDELATTSAQNDSERGNKK